MVRPTPCKDKKWSNRPPSQRPRTPSNRLVVLIPTAAHSEWRWFLLIVCCLDRAFYRPMTERRPRDERPIKSKKLKSRDIYIVYIGCGRIRYTTEILLMYHLAFSTVRISFLTTRVRLLRIVNVTEGCMQDTCRVFQSIYGSSTKPSRDHVLRWL